MFGIKWAYLAPLPPSQPPCCHQACSSQALSPPHLCDCHSNPIRMAGQVESFPLWGKVGKLRHGEGRCPVERWCESGLETRFSAVYLPKKQ